ncbi:MAG: hypothetical protein AAF387_09865 [Pseudomonadota bacterium]
MLDTNRFLQATSITTVCLVALVLILLSANYAQIVETRSKIENQLSSVNSGAEVNPQQEEIDRLMIEMSKEKLAEKKADRLLKDRLRELNEAVATVATAAIEREVTDPSEAAAKLKSTKPLIWKLGDKLPKEKQTLQALMQPVDKCVAAWSSGDGDCDFYKNILQTLNEVRERVGNEKV